MPRNRVEFPEANRQGETVEECLADLRSAVENVLAYRRETATASLGQGERLEHLLARSGLRSLRT